MRKLSLDEKRRALPGLEIIREYFDEQAAAAFTERRDTEAYKLRELGGEISIMSVEFGQEVKKQPRTTLKPDPYAEERGEVEYRGHDLLAADMDTVWSVGATPHDAIAAFLKARCGTQLSVDRTGPRMEAIIGGDEAYEWGYSFSDTNGDAFKAAGINVPGGVVLTWWK